MDYYFSLYMFLISCFMFSSHYKHLLSMVISMEFMMIWISYNMYIVLMYLEISSYMLMYFYIFSVCEGALALTLLVVVVRLHGNDYSNSLMVLKW